MATEGKNTLDLRRDLGWLLYGIDEDEKGAALDDLKKLITSNKITFEDSASFAEAIEPSTYQDCDRVTGLWCSDAKADHVLERAKFFFDRSVQAETEVNGNVLYYYQQDRSWLGSQVYQTTFWSAQLLVDYDTTGYELYRGLYSCDSNKVLQDWDRYFNEMTESELVPKAGEAFDTGSVDQHYWTKAVEKNQRLNVADQDFKKYITDVAVYYEITPNQALQVYAEGYLEFLAEINPADQKRVISSLFREVVGEWKKESTFIAYTGGDKYPVHRAYAEKLASLYPALSVDDIMAIVFIESSGKKEEVSDDEEHFGLMQLGKKEFRENLRVFNRSDKLSLLSLKAFTASVPEDTGVATAGDASIFAFEPNMAAGTTYLNKLLLQDSGTNPNDDLAVAVAAYNWGPGHMDRYLDLEPGVPVPPEKIASSRYKNETDYRCYYENMRDQTVDYLAKFLYFHTRLQALNDT